MKSILKGPSKVAAQSDGTDRLVGAATLVQALPEKAYGDPTAAGKMGVAVARSAARTHLAEARAASDNFKSLQHTYRELLKNAEPDLVPKILDAASLSYCSSLEESRLRVQAMERNTSQGYMSVNKVALGAAGLALLGVAYFAANRRK